VLILGFAFKENCPDLRNTRVVDVVRELEDYGIRVDVHDPWVDPEEAKREYGIVLENRPREDVYDGIVLAVAHDSFRDEIGQNLRVLGRETHVFCDLKSVFPPSESDLRL
jgi:UDP-N-acetyl-D-galactosamine dehydrogenase